MRRMKSDYYCKFSDGFMLGILTLLFFFVIIPVNTLAGGDKTQLPKPTLSLDGPSGQKITIKVKASSENFQKLKEISILIRKTDVEPNIDAKTDSIIRDYLTSFSSGYSRSYYLDPGSYVIIATAITNEPSNYDNSEPVMSNYFNIVSSGGSSGSGGSGGSSGSGGSGYTPTPTKLSDAKVLIYSSSPGMATIDMTGYDYGIGVEVYKGDTLVASRLLGYYGNRTDYTPIPYQGSTTFKYRVSTYGKNYSPWATVTIFSAKLGRPSLSVTKISATRAGLKWSGTDGATGFKVYKGNKLIKTLSNKKKSYIVKGKGAGKAKYSVQAIRSLGGGKYASGPRSKAVKGKANLRTYSGSSSVNSVSYGHAPFHVKKVTLVGNTYTVTGYVVNNRIFDLKKYSKFEITLLCNGKKVAYKKYTNMNMKVKAKKSKKVVLKIKGMGGVDFRNSEGTTIRWSTKPYWGPGISQW